MRENAEKKARIMLLDYICSHVSRGKRRKREDKRGKAESARSFPDYFSYFRYTRKEDISSFYVSRMRHNMISLNNVYLFAQNF